jgi:hypothetical protein
MSPTTITPWLQVLQGLLTPVIGLTTLYIAWQQWKGNKLKLVLDRYDRRLSVYAHVVGFLRLVQRDFKPEMKDILQFTFDTAEAGFLFRPDIAEYIDEMCKRALELQAFRAEYRDLFQPSPPAGYDHNKVVTGIHEQEVWFTKQLAVVKQQFKEYLDISR